MMNCPDLERSESPDKNAHEGPAAAIHSTTLLRLRSNGPWSITDLIRKRQQRSLLIVWSKGANKVEDLIAAPFNQTMYLYEACKGLM